MGKILRMLILLFFILAAKVATAQTEEIGGTILSIIFGKLPSVCEEGFSSSDCLKCLGVVKIIPLVFFIALFSFFLYHMFKQIGGKVQVSQPGQIILAPPSRELTPFEQRVITIISIIFAIVIMHAISPENLLGQLMFWINFMIVIAAITFIRIGAGVTGFTGLGAIIMTIIGALVVVAMLPYITGMISPVVQEWASMCLE